MKSNKFGLTTILMAAAEAAASTGAPAASSAVPTSNAEGAAPADAKKRAPKNPDNILNIVNGKLPLVLGFLIRFKETGTNAETAKKYCTSVGKVFDLKKGRNFGYLTEAYKPSADEVAAGKAWLTKTTAKGQDFKTAGGDVEGITKAIDALGVATPEEVAARNWVTRTVGQKAATGTAPVAGGSAAAAAPAAAAAKAGDKKLF